MRMNYHVPELTGIMLIWQVDIHKNFHNFVATSFLYQKWSSPITMVFWNETGLVGGQTQTNSSKICRSWYCVPSVCGMFDSACSPVKLLWEFHHSYLLMVIYSWQYTITIIFQQCTKLFFIRHSTVKHSMITRCAFRHPNKTALWQNTQERLPHTTDEVRHHLCRPAAYNPVFVRKLFSNDHVRQGNSKPCCQTVGSETSALFATTAESQTSCWSHVSAVSDSDVGDQQMRITILTNFHNFVATSFLYQK